MLCPLCQKESFSFFNIERADLDLLQCQGCGLVVLNAPMGRGDYILKMEQEFFSEEFLRTHDAFAKRLARNQARRRLKDIQKYKREGSLLEIGCGTGEFLDTARAAGFRCKGLDLSEAVACWIEKNYDIPVYTGTLLDLAGEEEKFDVIVMSHVLEHMEKPLELLKMIPKFLNPESILYIAVPNIASWEASFSGWTAYEPYHLFHFSPDILKRLLALSGFKLLSLSTREPFSGWFNTLVRTVLGDRYRSTKAQLIQPSSKEVGGRLLRYGFNVSRLTFGYLTSPLRWVQGALGKGEEIIAIARPL